MGDYIKSLLYVPLFSFFSGIQAYLPFDIMTLLGLKAAAAATGAGLMTFDLNNLAATQGAFKLAAQGEALMGSALSNPTTGYSWVVDADGTHKCGPEGSIIVDQTYVRNEAGKDMSGVGGVAHFSVTATSKAVSGSKCSIGFMEAQPWN